MHKRETLPAYIREGIIIIDFSFKFKCIVAYPCLLYTSVNLTQNYGMSELMGPGVSGECLELKGMHINEAHFIAEVIDSATGEVLPPGETGELVITCISKVAMHLIRYRTRDITRLMYEPCPCGRTTARMENLSGRCLLYTSRCV